MMKELQDIELYLVNGGGERYLIYDECGGVCGYYYWDANTGQCWTVIGNECY